MTADEATRIVMSHRLLRRYVLPGERVVLATRRHWARLAGPGLLSLAVLVACAWLSYVLEPTLGENAYLVLWLWFASLARFVWRLLLWRVEWFVATDKRMLLATGLITHQVAMMPLMKVTDMRYSRSVLGQLLGYGKFLLESAGQDQALRELDWMKQPDATYRELCALIFTPAERPPSDGEDDGGPTTTAHPGADVPPRPAPQQGPQPGRRPFPDEPPIASDVTTGATPPVVAPVPVVVPGRGTGWSGADEELGASDTQPVQIVPRPASGSAAAPGRAESPERAWEVCEPSAVFVDLREERERD